MSFFVSVRLPISPLEWALFAVLFTVAFWNIYLIFCAFDRAWDAGKKPHWLAYAMSGPVILVGLAMDIAGNITAGSIMFLQWPWYKGAGHPFKWTFTRRVRYWYRAEGWRGARARWWAELLNTFDPEHVK